MCFAPGNLSQGGLHRRISLSTYGGVLNPSVCFVDSSPRRGALGYISLSILCCAPGTPRRGPGGEHKFHKMCDEQKNRGFPRTKSFGKASVYFLIEKYCPLVLHVLVVPMQEKTHEKHGDGQTSQKKRKFLCTLRNKISLQHNNIRQIQHQAKGGIGGNLCFR